MARPRLGTRLPDRYDEGSHQAQLAATGVLSEYMSIGSVPSAALVVLARA